MLFRSVHTHDATLVAKQDSLEGLPLILKQLAITQNDKLAHHQVVYRPWGHYRTLVESIGFKVKKITVKSGAKLSTNTIDSNLAKYVRLLTFYLLDLINLCAT